MQQIVEYTPDSLLRTPLLLIRQMAHDLVASRELAWRLFVRDISARYRQSMLGFLWVFLPPLATAAVFILLNKEAILNAGNTSIPYPAYVLVGTVLWQLFIDSLNAPLNIVTKNRSMLAKVNFPREALIISSMGQVLFDFAIKLIIILAVFIIYRIPLSWGVVLAPLPIIMTVLLGLVIGMLLTPIGVLYTDIASGLAIFTSLWFFVTPVVYTPPDTWLFSLLVQINPVSPLLIAARDLLTLGSASNVGPVLVISGVVFVGLAFMWLLYRLAIPILIEKMSA